MTSIPRPSTTPYHITSQGIESNDVKAKDPSLPSLPAQILTCISRPIFLHEQPERRMEYGILVSHYKLHRNPKRMNNEHTIQIAYYMYMYVRAFTLHYAIRARVFTLQYAIRVRILTLHCMYMYVHVLTMQTTLVMQIVQIA